MTLEQYSGRIALAKMTGNGIDANSTAMLSEAICSLNPGEMHSWGAHIGAGLLDPEVLVDVSAPLSADNRNGQDYNSVISFENMRHLPGRTNPLMHHPATGELVHPA